MQWPKDSSRPRPTVVAPSERREPGPQQTAGIRREEAFAADDRWIGYVRSDAPSWSGWHHHGETDTYFHVLSGTLEVEYGAAGETILIRAGDFGHIPPRIVHRERTPEGPVEQVLVRIGRGPSVVNVDGPPVANESVTGQDR